MPRTRPLAAIGALALALSLALSLILVLSTVAPATAELREPPSRPGPAAQPVPVWLQAQEAHPRNPTNPLAGRVWGIYEDRDPTTTYYQNASEEVRAQLASINTRPRARWFGSWAVNDRIAMIIQRYIESSQEGDPSVLSQMVAFRMAPWEHNACERTVTDAERASYKHWIRQLALGIGDSPMLIEMQPDMPFLWCAPKRQRYASLLRYASKTLSALPHTSVYLDAGAADWCKPGTAHEPRHCARLLKWAGVRHTRGFALDSTHYTGPRSNIRKGAAIVRILERDGFGTKHFIVETSKSGTPTEYRYMVPAGPNDIKDNGRVCTRDSMRRCVALGIPPTAQAWHPGWGLPDKVRALAARHVDGFVWFGRPWIYNQADPYLPDRAIALGTNTRWPASLDPTLP